MVISRLLNLRDNTNRMEMQNQLEDSAPAQKAFSNLEFTGERIVPGKTIEPLFREHEARYVFAGKYVAGKNVLDVACGSGVGSAYLLAVGASKVLGLDVDAEAIDFARTSYKKVQFLQGDATAIPLPDSSQDVVVSFETIEHIKDQHRLLLEFRRLLKPGGLLICSTPNRSISKWTNPNPFHVHEMSATEFEDYLRDVFPIVEIHGQIRHRYIYYIVRTMVIRALGALRLKNVIKSALKIRKPEDGFRVEFNDAAELNPSIAPYKASFFSQPTYLIAVAQTRC